MYRAMPCGTLSAPAMKPIVIAQDRGSIAEAVAADLASAGYDDITISDASKVKAGDTLLLGIDDPDVLLLAERLRAARSDMPILVLTGRGGAEARVRALRAGADDALDHPYLVDELALRVGILRRRLSAGAAQLVHGTLTIDRLERRVWRDGREIAVLSRELALLLCLARRAGEVVGRRTLLADVWKLGFDPGTNVVEVQVSRLRAKLDHGFSSSLIETVKGVGYRLNDHALGSDDMPKEAAA